MKKKHKIHNKLLKSLFFDNLKVVGLLIIVLPIYIKWRNGTDFVFDEFWIWILFGFTIITNIPAVILYLNYYLENKNTEFTLDYKNEKILITKDRVKKEYLKTDIEKSTYHLGIYYKNVIDRVGRTPMLISDFGYWDLQFKNGDRYYLTNILHDFLHDTPIVPKTKYRFRLYPYIIENYSKEPIDLKENRKEKKTLTESFVEKFKTKSEKELLEIIKNKKKYQEEAVRAVEILMKNKNIG